MFVKNVSKAEITIRNKGKVIKIGAGKVATIDELIMSRERIKSLYGRNIVILGEIEESKEEVKEPAEEFTVEEKAEVEEAIKDILLALSNVSIEEKDEEVKETQVEETKIEETGTEVVEEKAETTVVSKETPKQSKRRGGRKKKAQ